MTMKIVCKECGTQMQVVELCKSTGKHLIKEDSGKHYVKDILCKGCDRVLIEGKEVPKESIQKAEALRRHDRGGDTLLSTTRARGNL